MIVTCASCLTKYHLDDSRISEKGSKVRCSRCKHVFYVFPPPEKKEEVEESFESFNKYLEEFKVEEQKGIEPLPFEKAEEKEEKYLISDQPSQDEIEPFAPEFEEVKEPEIKEVRPKRPAIEPRRRKEEKRKPLLLYAIVIVIVILLIGVFYFWMKTKSDLEAPRQKVTRLWESLLGKEKEGLIVKDLTGYEEKAGGVGLFVIEGKVENQSSKTKKHIKVKVAIFDQERMKVAEKETFCGQTLTRGELKSLPSDFFSGDMLIQPKTEEERNISSGKTVPFIILFKDLPAQAREFKIEIVEAPSL